MPQQQETSATDDIKLLYEINLEVLGDRIRRARLEKKWSQRDLSSDLFTSAYLSSLELGKTRPTYKSLTGLADRLGKSLDYFLRPSSGIGTELDEEQTRILELRVALLKAQTRLEKYADEEAQAALDEVKDFLPRLTSVERARYYQLRGRYFNMRNLPTDAIAELEEARKYLQQGYDAELEVLIEFGLGSAHYNQRRIMPALTHFLAALDAINNHQDEAAQLLKWKVLVNVGHSYLLLNNPEQAIRAYQEALDNAKDMVDLTAQAHLHYGLASVYREQGDFQRAALNLGRCMQIYQHFENQETLLTTYNHLAQIYAQTDQYQKAEEQVNLALKLARLVLVEGDDRCEELNALVTLTLIEQKQKNLAKAQEYLLQALDLREVCQDKFHVSRLYRVAGEVWAEVGDRPRSQDYFKRALSELEGTGMPSSLSEVYYSYGQRMKEWGELDEAFKLLEQAYLQRELGRAER
jgi:tetratricopeptide (TPR) repeat protein